MQIHELNQQNPKRIDEINLLGTTKQVLKNPTSMFKSSALAASQQAADQTLAAKSAQKLAAQGYQTGQATAPATTLAQQLLAVRNNPAIQQQVSNLTAQWKQQLNAVIAAAQSRQNIPESAVIISNPEATKDPAERKLLDLIYKQQAKKGTSGAADTVSSAASTLQPDSDDKANVNRQLQEISLAFTRWSDPRLATNGITMDSVRRNREYNKILSDQLTKIAIESLANPASTSTAAAISEYFNIAIAAIQVILKSNTSGSTRAAPAAPAATATPTPNDTEVLNQLQQQGFPVTRANLEKLGEILTTSTGSNFIKNTGNPILNAIARIAGMRVGS